MSFVLVIKKIDDFDGWKTKFDAQLHARRRIGLIDLHILRDDSDPNTVTLLFGTTDLDKARAFVASNDWQDSMTEAGVVGQPQVQFLNECHWYEPH